MKKLLLIMALAVTLTSCGSKTEELYPRTMTVTELNTEEDEVILTDYVGYTWSFYGIEDWQIGDICSCIMDTEGTENITDDTIINIRYNGRN